nr:GGDEF domain-containing protein [Lachnospiraceae bacterium]
AAFQELFDHEQALKYFQQARELVKEVGEENLKKGMLFILYCNLSVEYEALGDYASAERAIQETEKHMDDVGITGMEMAYQIAKCKLALRKGQSDKVMEYYNDILDEILHWDNMSYFWADIVLITEISIALERYDDLYKLVKKMEETTGKSLRNVSNFYRKLYVQELNIRYYEFIHDEENLQKAEIEYGRLCRKQTEDLLVRRCQGMSGMVNSFENELEKERMNRKIENDQLTGCGNRYKLKQDAPEMITNGIMDKIPIALGIIDVDYFKYVNDTYGHLTGDEYLNLAAKIIRQNVGDYGEVYRYGGDEFVVMLIAEEEEVHRIAKKIKDDILEACLPNEESPEGVITVSQGWVIDIAKVSLQLDDLIRKADRKLYVIKKTGRNGYAIGEE